MKGYSSWEKLWHPNPYQPTYPAGPSVFAEPEPVCAAAPYPNAASRRWDLRAEKMVLLTSLEAPAQATPTIPAEENHDSLQILRVKAASSKAEQYSCSSRSSSSWGQGKGEPIRGSLVSRAPGDPCSSQAPWSHSLIFIHHPVASGFIWSLPTALCSALHVW